MKFSSFKFLPFLLLGACTSLQTNTPVAQVMPSENVAAEELEAAFRAESSRLHTITDDASNRPPTISNKNEGSNLLLSSLNYGANDRLQFGGGVIGLFQGFYGQSRFQFLGSPRNQNQIGWSGGVHGEIYTTYSGNSGDQKGTFGPGGYNWKAKATTQAIGGGVSFGYRWNQGNMAYIGTTYNVFQIKSSINQDPTADGSDPGANYDFTNDGHSMATGIGWVIGGGSFRLIPTVQWVEYQVDKQNERGFWWSLALEFGGSAKPPKLVDPDYPSK